jgi:transposase
MKRHELTDAQWARLAPYLPPQRPATGRPHHDHRPLLNGILFRLRTGVPWRDLPERFGPWQTVYRRSRRWQQAGVWAPVLATLPTEADRAGRRDWDRHVVDGTVVRAHQYAAGAKGGTQHPGTRLPPLGAKRRGFSTKVHIRTEGGGKPLCVTVTGGERHEQSALPTLLDTGAVRRPQGGRPRLRPRRLAGDKGYSSQTVRTRLRQRRIGAVIPRRSTEPPQRCCDRVAYRARNHVERLIGRFTQFRAIATRYDKLGQMDHAGLTVVSILFWL